MEQQITNPLVSEMKAQPEIQEIQKPIVKEEENFVEKVKEKEILQNKIPEKTKTESKPVYKENPLFPEPKPKKVIERKPRETPAFILEISAIFSPFFSGLDLFKQLYSKYKTEGKLPIFFMTIAGIIAILFGLGYFLQSDLLGIYSDVLRNVLGFGVAITIGFMGIRLQKKEKIYQEFGSALISLAILLGYLVTYYTTQMTSFPIFSSATVGFLLIVATTGISIFLSFKFETKIIALLSLIGGALAPLFLENSGNSDLYFAYLWILIFAANFIANKIKWNELNYISFILFVAIVETSIFYTPSNSIFFIGILHAFAYLFFYIVLFEKTKLKKTLTKDMVFILAGNLSLLLYHLFVSIDDNFVLGFAYIGNASLFIGILAFYWKNISKKIKVGLFITIGVFLGFAIPCLFSKELVGLFWAIEAFLLIVLGYQFKIITVRKEGYILLTIAFYKLIIQASFLLESWNNHNFENAFIAWIIIGILFFTIIVLNKKYKDEEQFGLEISLARIVEQIFPIWATLTFFLISNEFFGAYAYNLLIIPMFALIYWGKVWESKFIEGVGILHLFALLIAYGVSSFEMETFYLSKQTIYGKSGVGLFLASLYLLKLYYQKIKYETSSFFELISYLRILFFASIPYIFLRQSYKYIEDLFIPSIWIAFMISYGLNRWIKAKTLWINSILIFGVSVILNLSEISTIGLLIGILSLISLLILEKSFDNKAALKSSYKTVLFLIPYIFVIYVTALLIENDLLKDDVSVVFIGLLIATIFFFQNKYKFLQATGGFAIYFSMFIGITGGLFSFSEEGFLPVFTLLLFLTGIHLTYNHFFEKDGSYFKTKMAKNVHFAFLQILIFITYLVLIPTLNLEIDGPTLTIFLAIHAISLVFVALRKQLKYLNKISIFLFAIGIIKLIIFDIRNFSTNGKVLVFVLLGILLLIASFAYVKLKPKFEQMDNEDLETIE
ncbi:DUF2339 domain-containing protein [Aureivirga marina]|uniref:DUF2339 domain-containing protein n=1 Tax=Aureivirga marina TaxID=1182451 RepID=UPI0018CB67D4|nr:DUF2339 domain-containing protein [Aureivirga marina]